MLYNIITILITGALCWFFFYEGYKLGKDGTVAIPKIKKRDKEAEKQRKRNETIMRNIEAYDGTDRGQVEV